MGRGPCRFRARRRVAARVAQSHTGVGGETTRNVDREDKRASRNANVIDPLDRLRKSACWCARDTDAEEAINDEIEGCVLGNVLANVAAAAYEGGVSGFGSGLGKVMLTERNQGHALAGFLQCGRGNPRIATIVAGPGEHENVRAFFLFYQ